MVNWYTLWTILVFVLGVGSFLRIVAKDVHRREKYLILRLEQEEKDRETTEKERKLKEAMDQQRQNAEAEEGAEEIVAEVAPEEIVAERAA